jgi:hypothetical protein
MIAPLYTRCGWSTAYAVHYGEKDWPSRSYRLFVFEAE